MSNQTNGVIDRFFRREESRLTQIMKKSPMIVVRDQRNKTVCRFSREKVDRVNSMRLLAKQANFQNLDNLDKGEKYDRTKIKD